MRILLAVCLLGISCSTQARERQMLLEMLKDQPPGKQGYHCVNYLNDDKTWTQECQLEEEYIVQIPADYFLCVPAKNGDRQVVCHVNNKYFSKDNLVDSETGEPYNEVCDQTDLYFEEGAGNEACHSLAEAIPEGSVPPYLHKEIIQPTPDEDWF